MTETAVSTSDDHAACLDRQPGATPAARGTSRPGLILALVLVGQFMALLDVAIVNVAAPSLQTDLGSSGAALQLVVSGYTIAYAVLLITGARLGERLGFSRVFLAGLGAVHRWPRSPARWRRRPTRLIGFRLAQGAGSALMVPQVISLIQRTFTGPARVKALGAYTAVAVLRHGRRPGRRRAAGQRRPVRHRLARGLRGQRADRCRPPPARRSPPPPLPRYAA